MEEPGGSREIPPVLARKVIWSDEAIADLATIVGYIAADSRTAAEKLGLEIFDRTRLLSDFPLAAPMVPEERAPAVREIIVEPCRVIYEISVNNQTVDILRVWPVARGRPEVRSGHVTPAESRASQDIMLRP
ncbi:MAG: type II toxin-antitoxin system RelE/ParE family toxin [Opitutaceae bacterium]|nr:type II toxin-antitoxin system RelE/ParE family toxin [Opitutaceae bacterium]